MAWHLNFTVLPTGTAWSCFSIFSGITHCSAGAAEGDKGQSERRLCLRCRSRRDDRAQEETTYSWAFHCLLTDRWIIYFPLRMTHRLLHLPRISRQLQRKSDVWKPSSKLSCANRVADLLMGASDVPFSISTQPVSGLTFDFWPQLCRWAPRLCSQRGAATAAQGHASTSWTSENSFSAAVINSQHTHIQTPL